MLILYDFWDIFGPFVQLIDTLFIWLNALIYDFISFLYQIFLALSSAVIFTSEQYQTIADRVYILIGVVSLFLISYALLRAIINPDNASKGDYSINKIVPNILKVVVLIAFVPTIFSFAYKVQEVIATTNVIPRIIMGDKTFGESQGDLEKEVSAEGNTFSYKTAGRTLSNEIFRGFLHPSEEFTDREDEIIVTDCKFGICESSSGYSFEQAINDVDEGAGFSTYANFGYLIHGDDKQLDYNGIFQLVAGIFVIYVFINYCLDMGLRAVKLGYFQLIAPIPILTILIPGQDKIFKNWLKNTVSTFADVFIRIAVLFFGILIIQMLPNVSDSMWANSLMDNNTTVHNFARIFVILGILMFIKQAPKLISDIFGISSGSFKLGIKDKLGEALDFSKVPGISTAEGAITGAAGAAWTAGVNGGKIGKAALLGAAYGAKGKGNQFEKQRQGLWTDVYGMKGPAGFFGGRPIYNKFTDELKNKTNDEFLQFDPTKGIGRNSEIIRKMEDADEFKNLLSSNSKKAYAAVNELRKAEQSYQSNINSYQSKINNLNNNTIPSVQRGYDSINGDYELKRQAIEKNYVDYLKQTRDIAANSGDVAQVNAIGQKLQEVQSGHGFEDALKYSQTNNVDLYNNFERVSSNRNTAKNVLDNLNRELESYKSSLEAETNAMNNDRRVLGARKAVNDLELDIKDDLGNKVNITSASQVPKEVIEKYAQTSARKQYIKANDEYKWRVQAEDKEKREADISKAKSSTENQAMQEIFESALKKYGGSDKK